MIKLIDREEIFFKSALIDHYVSKLQTQWYAGHGYELEGWAEGVNHRVRDPYDHLEPFHNDKELMDDFTILGYIKRDRIDWLAQRSNAFIHFFELIGVGQLYLIDDLMRDWMEFPFGDADKHEIIKRLVNRPHYYEAFEFNIEDLRTILPLFNYVGRYHPIIWLYPANTETKFCMYLCTEASFHTSFDSRDREKMMAAASGADLAMGGKEVCGYKVEEQTL